MGPCCYYSGVSVITRKLPTVVWLAALSAAACPTAQAVEPVETKTAGNVQIRVFAPPKEKADGRVLMLLHGGNWPLHPKDFDVSKTAATYVARGCVVIAADLSGLPEKARSNYYYYERFWRGPVNDYAEKYAGKGFRTLPVPAGFEVADPIAFYKQGEQTYALDLVYPASGDPQPTIVSIWSGTFGLEAVFDMAVSGFAVATVRDPRYEFKLAPQEIARYGAAAARAIRANARNHHLTDKIGIIGKSKHGFCAGLIGAYSPTIAPEPQAMHDTFSGRIDAVGMITDSYDPATRAEDYKAAGHAVDENPGDHDDAGSPVRVLAKGAPPFLLADAHGRNSKQVDRMVEALTKHGVPYQQMWNKEGANFVAKNTVNVRVFFEQNLRSSGTTQPK